MAPSTVVAYLVQYYIPLKYIYLHLRTSTGPVKTSLDQSRPVVNRSWFELVQTGLVTAKDRKRLVHTGPVRFFAGFGIARTGLGSV